MSTTIALCPPTQPTPLSTLSTHTSTMSMMPQLSPPTHPKWRKIKLHPNGNHSFLEMEVANQHGHITDAYQVDPVILCGYTLWPPVKPCFSNDLLSFWLINHYMVLWCFLFFFNFIMFIFCATPRSCLTQEGFIFQIPFHARIPHGSSKTGAQEKHKLL